MGRERERDGERERERDTEAPSEHPVEKQKNQKQQNAQCAFTKLTPHFYQPRLGCYVQISPPTSGADAGYLRMPLTSIPIWCFARPL